MAKITVRSTFALDPQTVDSLDRLARHWVVSKSEALRRVVRVAASVEEMDATSDSLAAFDELQKTLGIDEQKAEAWILRIREERRVRSP